MANVALSTLIDKFLQETLSDAEDKELIREMLDLGTQAEPEFVNVTVKQILGVGGTITASTPLLDLAQTWNSSGVTFTALKLNVTNTASASASLLLDLQVDGSSKFSVKKDGTVSAEVYGFSTSSMSFLMGTDFAIRSTNDYVLGVLPSGKMRVRSGFNLEWSNDATNYYAGSVDLSLNRASAATLQLGENHATTGTTQTIKSHDVTTGYGSNLNISAGSGSSGKGILTLDGSNRTQASSFNVRELYSTLFNFGILTPPLNGLAELVSPTSGEIYIAFNSGNSESILWAIIVQYSTDESSWSETSVLENGDGMSPSLNINGLEPEVTYYIRWRSRAYFNPNVFTDWSSTQIITTPPLI